MTSAWTVHGGTSFSQLVQVKDGQDGQEAEDKRLAKKLAVGSVSPKKRTTEEARPQRVASASVHGGALFAYFEQRPASGRRLSVVPGTPPRRRGSLITRELVNWDEAAAHRAAERWRKEEERMRASAPVPKAARPDAEAQLTDYTLGKCVGIGHFATVHAAVRRLTGERCAVKISREAVYGTAEAEASQEAAFFKAEVALLRGRAAVHPYIMRCLGHGRMPLDSGGAASFLLLELLPGPDLRVRLLRSVVSVAEAGAWARQLAQALAHLHAHGVAHRDIKPSNLMLAADGSLRVVDFGLATRLDDRGSVAGGSAAAAAGEGGEGEGEGEGALSQRVGCVGYMAPETYAERTCTTAVDVFALGRVLLALLARASPLPAGARWRTATRMLPFQLMPCASTYEAAHCRPVLGTSWPKALAGLVEACCATDPATRPTAAAAAARLEEWSQPAKKGVGPIAEESPEPNPLSPPSAPSSLNGSVLFSK